MSFAELWTEQLGERRGRVKAGEMDAVLHTERLMDNGRKATFEEAVGHLPTGAFVRWRDGAYLVIAGRLFRWSPEGYTAALDVAPGLVVEVLTPRSALAVFAAGYDADVHESALVHM